MTALLLGAGMAPETADAGSTGAAWLNRSDGQTYAVLKRVQFVDGLAVDVEVVPGDGSEEDGSLLEPRPMNSMFTFDNPLFNPAAARLDRSEADRITTELMRRRSARRDLARFIQNSDWEGTLDELNRRLQFEPENPDLLKRKAALHGLRGEFEVAERYFRLYLKQYPDDVIFLAGWAQTLFQLARFEDAMVVIRRCLSQNEKYLAALYTRACIYQAIGQDPNQGINWRALSIQEVESVAYWLYGDREETSEVLSADGFSRLCDVMLGDGCSANLVLIPDSLSSGRTAFLKGEWAKALVYYDLARGYGVSGVAVDQQLARCYYEMGKRVEAMKLLYGLTLSHPEVASVWYNLGYVLVNNASYTEAAEVFEKAVALEPSDGMIVFALACAYAGEGSLDKAWPLLEQLVETHPQEMPRWLEGNKPYLKAIQEDARFPALEQAVAAKNST